MACELKKGIYWVGAIDWDIRDFHGYATPKGTSYNSYLLVDEKIALVDTVKFGFSDELLRRVSEIVKPEDVDYLIVNHLEKDHSGSIEQVMGACKKARILCTERGKKGLVDWYGEKWDITSVKTGTTMSLGKKTLAFLETPMLHWPDNMVTYVVEDRVLLSNDAFGQHIASSQRYDSDMPCDILEDARTYYANILMPFGTLIQKALEKVSELKIAPDIIAPSHGLMWRDPGKIVEAYGKWSRFESKRKAVLVYDTMWGTTDRMARFIAKGLADEGVEVKMINLRKSPMSEAVSELQDARMLLVGSPTLNNGMFPTVGAFLTYIKGLKPRNKLAVAFGGYGWGGGAVKEINAMLKQMELEVLDGLEIKYVMKEDGEARCIELGKQLAKRLS